MKKIISIIAILLVLAVSAAVAAEHVVVIKTEFQETARNLLRRKVTIGVSKIESKLDGTIISEEDLGECEIDIDGEFMAFCFNKPYSSEQTKYELR